MSRKFKYLPVIRQIHIFGQIDALFRALIREVPMVKSVHDMREVGLLGLQRINNF